MRRIRVVAALAAVVVAAACTSGVDDLRAAPGIGWGEAGGSGTGASYSTTPAAAAPVLHWERSTFAPLPGSVTTTRRTDTADRYDVTLISDSGAGCTLFSYNLLTGRKTYCLRMPGITGTPTVDGFGQVYVGDARTFYGLSPLGALRWRYLLPARPIASRIIAPDAVAVLTEDSGLAVFGARDGRARGATFDLDGYTATSAFAVDADARRIYLVARRGSRAPELVAVDYMPDGSSPTLAWTAPVGTAGATGSPVVSAGTVLVRAADGAVWGFASDGGRRFSERIATADAPLSASPSGLVVPTPAPGSPLIALRAGVEGAREAWRRDDLRVIGPATQTPADGAEQGGDVVLVPAEGPDGRVLLRLSAADGRTLASTPLTGAGRVTSLAVAANGMIAAGSADGRVQGLG